eukprot:Gb_23206 [translate_table: standard]
MAIARTGVFVDDYLEYSSTLPAELQRLLSTMRELDERSHMMLNQTREQTKYCLSFPSQSSKKGTPEQEEMIEKLKKDIEANQENTLSLCTEKVLLAQQAYDLVIPVFVVKIRARVVLWVLGESCLGFVASFGLVVAGFLPFSDEGGCMLHVDPLASSAAGRIGGRKFLFIERLDELMKSTPANVIIHIFWPSSTTMKSPMACRMMSSIEESPRICDIVGTCCMLLGWCLVTALGIESLLPSKAESHLKLEQLVMRLSQRP